VTAPDNRAARTGLYALDKVDLFNLLCIPPYAPDADLDLATDWAPAAQYCRERRAFLIVDPRATWSVDAALGNAEAFRASAGKDAALYFPRVLARHPFDAGRLMACAPCGMVAGAMSRTDAAQGVWTAPTNIALRGISGTSIQLTQTDQQRLMPVGINCLRDFPGRGLLIWGAYTLAGDDTDLTHVNVRRFFLFIEQSIDQGTQWAAFEPNSEPTWSALVRSVGTFLMGVWRAGALVGTKANEAFFVKCDRSTMTEDDIRNGRLVAIIGLAMVRPAEFVILRFSQKTAEASR
jgi:phage tail sheath protein FI